MSNHEPRIVNCFFCGKTLPVSKYLETCADPKDPELGNVPGCLGCIGENGHQDG